MRQAEGRGAHQGRPMSSSALRWADEDDGDDNDVAIGTAVFCP